MLLWPSENLSKIYDGDNASPKSVGKTSGGPLHVRVCVCVCDFCDRCDAGFESSETCTLPNNRHLPSTLVAAISSDEDLLSSFASVQGADVDYGCGVVSSGKAAVFNGPEQRLVETISLNTSASRLYGRLA